MMEGRAEVSQLVDEGEGGRGGDARQFISLISDSSYASLSTTVRVQYMGLKRHVKVMFRGGRERM